MAFTAVTLPQPLARLPQRARIEDVAAHRARALLAFSGSRHGQDQSAHRRGAWRRHRPGGCHRGAAGRGRDRAVHRPLPQGEDRRPRRHAAAQAGRAPQLPARAGGPPRHGAEKHRGAGQADTRVVALHRRRADQGRAGRPVRALQAQAPHQGADRARGRPRAARATRCSPTPRSTPQRKPPSTSTPARASRTPRPRSTAPATS